MIIRRERKNEKELDEVLKEIAKLKPCTKDVGKKVYHLKEGFQEKYNMFYYGYTREQQTQAQEFQLQSRSKAGEGTRMQENQSSPHQSHISSTIITIIAVATISSNLEKVSTNPKFIFVPTRP